MNLADLVTEKKRGGTATSKGKIPVKKYVGSRSPRALVGDATYSVRALEKGITTTITDLEKAVDRFKGDAKALKHIKDALQKMKAINIETIQKDLKAAIDPKNWDDSLA